MINKGEKQNVTLSGALKDGRISNTAQAFSVRRYTLFGGAEDGIKVVDCDNGKLRFLLNESKACDVMQIYYLGENVSFLSKNGFCKRETPFPSRFEGGALYTCGLDAVGNVEGKEMHGGFHNVPARIIKAECEEDGIRVESEIRVTALFGQNIAVRRSIFSPYGSGKIILSDSIINIGTRDEEYCLLYHINIGYPLLTAGGKIIIPNNGVRPITERAKSLMGELWTFTAPVDNAEEACYYFDTAEGKASYVNPEKGRRFTVSFSDNLGKFVLWKSNASQDYAMGLEPTTTEFGTNLRYRKIAAGETERFSVTLDVDQE